MNQKIKLILLLNFIIALFLFSTISSSYGATREWNVGDVYIWGERVVVSTTNIDKIQLITAISSVDLMQETKINLTVVDTLAKQYDAIITTDIGTYTQIDIPYGMADYIDNQDLAVDFEALWDWNELTNKSVLYSLGFSFQAYYLIEPNWLLLNNFFKDYFDPTLIVDTYVNSNTTITHNVTFAETLNNATKFELMGVKNNLEKARTEFTETNTKLTINFDYSNVLNEKVWNGSMFLYYPYDEFSISLSFEYSEGGVLEKYLYEYSYKLSLEESTEEVYIKNEMELGGIKSLTANYNFLVLLPALFIITGLIKIKRK